MNDFTSDLGGADFSAEENAFFESGGESPIPATPVVTTPEPESAPAPKAAEPDPAAVAKVEADKVEKMVSLSALHEERGRRKAIENEKRAMELQLAELRGKFSLVEKLNAPKPAEPVKEPTVEEDIFGVVRKQGETLAQMQTRAAEAEQARAADTERQSAVNTYRAQAAEFERETPDFKPAYNHLLNSRAAELQAMGYAGQALQDAIANDEMSIAAMAKQNGKNPAEIIYGLAQLRGYKTAAMTAAETASAKVAADAEAAKVAAAAEAAAKLDTINKGQAANKSLSNTGGTAGDGDITGEMLLKMPLDEFEAWTSKNPAKAKKLMGG